jgi:hypothetical protein
VTTLVEPFGDQRDVEILEGLWTQPICIEGDILPDEGVTA